LIHLVGGGMVPSGFISLAGGGMFMYAARLALVVLFMPCAFADDGDPRSPGKPVDRSQAEPRGTCGGGDSCCIEHGPGCSDFTCCTAVCDIDPSCCQDVWDEVCVSLAQDHCGDLCVSGICPASGDCCSNHSSPGCEEATCCGLVCGAMDSCCTAVWSLACAALAGKLCDQCDPVVKCPGDGSCCSAHPATTGCDRAACCELVCDLDIFCCRGEWDTVCANKARLNCPNVCECVLFGDFDATAAVDLLDFASFQLCFSGAGGGPLAAGCACADYDGDDDADLADFARFGP